MRTVSMSLARAQRAYLPIGKLALGMLLILAAVAALPVPSLAQKPAVTPIQHVIVVFGENRSFDHVFGTYVPKRGQFVWNLASLGIVNTNGTPGPFYFLANQNSASDTTTFLINPTSKTPFSPLPDPLAGGDESCNDTYGEPFCTLSIAETYEPNLDSNYFQYLITGATGLVKHTPDTRIANYSNLPPGPFPLTSSAGTLIYDDYAASPVHRFYQMWQQTDCSVKNANFLNPSGCINDLFPWVEVTVGAGSNGNAQPANFSTNWCSTCSTTGEGSTSMGFYNVSTGDAPYLTSLANQYTLLDNMHQGVMGGTGPNHIMLGYADAMPYTDGNGNIATPPAGEIENPNPQAGTNNYYTEDGYGNSNPALIQGGTYTDCADTPLQPGVQPIVTYLGQLHISPNCAPGSYYLLNNYNPGFYVEDTTGTPTGYVLPLSEAPYTIPPTTQRHIGDVLGAAGLSYYFFGENWNIYAGIGEPGGQGDPGETNPMDAYCNICNPFQYASDIMTNPAQISAHIADMTGPNGFYTQLAAGNLPNVSIIQPSGFVDGHPASSKIDLWEGFVKDIIESVQANQTLWNSTAIILIFDEGGGYYDSGYIQPVDFFGDGTRMPSLIISPYTTGGNVYHGYADHASIDKFIERNWNLPTISDRSRDRLPNPITFFNPYVPLNSPALDDLFGAFNFHQH